MRRRCALIKLTNVALFVVSHCFRPFLSSLRWRGGALALIMSSSPGGHANDSQHADMLRLNHPVGPEMYAKHANDDADEQTQPTTKKSKSWHFTPMIVGAIK